MGFSEKQFQLERNCEEGLLNWVLHFSNTHSRVLVIIVEDDEFLDLVLSVSLVRQTHLHMRVDGLWKVEVTWHQKPQ